MKKLSNDEFIEKSSKVHNNKYDYSKTNYVNIRTNVVIICPEHGEFTQNAKSHIDGSGCRKCCKTEPLTTQSFIEKSSKVHNNKYDYSKTNYVNMRTNVVIICPKHGEFTQNAKSHIDGKGCIMCTIGNTEDFISRCSIVHDNKYDYSMVQYIRSWEKIKIICPIHGEFEQTASSHGAGKGCPRCKESKGELKITQWLNTYGIEYIREKRFNDCRHIKPLPFDFYIPSLNMCIEYDGELHFIPLRVKSKQEEYKYKLHMTMYRDDIKNKYCDDNGIKLLRIPYIQFDNIEQILSDNLING